MRVTELRAQNSAAELSYAAQMNVRGEGNEDAAKLLAEAMQTTPRRSTRIREAWKMHNVSVQNPTRMLTAEEALSFYIDGDLSKSLWIRMRQNQKICNAPQIYPAYRVLIAERNKCMPIEEHITITEKTAEITLQALLDNTVGRLVVMQGVVLDTLSDEELCNLELITKWGFDGASGQSRYKQISSNNEIDDSSICITSLVPLQIRITTNPSKIVWQNIRSSSSRFCRPIRIRFAKETKELTKTEVAMIEKEISSLQSTSIDTTPRKMNVSHNMVCTMFDGKVVSCLSSTACQSCSICGSTPKQFNNIAAMLGKPIRTDILKYGLSSLHAHIRFMECLVHIAYRLDIKVCEVRTPIQKESMKARKKIIQDTFRLHTGLIVDVPKQGSGTTNDGNTARRFFENPELTASITGIKKPLVEMFSVILSVLSSGYEIDTNKFREYCIKTAELYVKEYKWYKIPSSVHRILIHGAEIIEAAVLPIGVLSEDPQESRNKDIKKFRESRARKCSRIATNRDVFNRLMISSDPLISSMQKTMKKHRTVFSQAALNLLKEPEVPTNNDCSSEDDDENEEI